MTGFFGEGEETGKALIGAGWQLTDFQLAAAIEDDTNAFQLAEGAEQVLPNENSIIMAFDTETGAFTTTNVERLQLSDRQEIGASDLDVSNRETITRTEAESAFETIGNTAPEADDVLAVAGENSATISLNAAYSDADTSNSHVFLIDTSGTLGQVTNNGDGTFSYDPSGQFENLAAGETATDTFTYTVDDGEGGTDTATVTITITGANDAPEAEDVAANANEDGAVISVNASYSDADATDSHGFSIDTSGTLGRVTDTGDGTFSYDPNGQFENLAAGETATDTFTYTVDDGEGGTDTATVTITITGENDAPEAEDDTAPGLVTEDETATIDVDTLLVNDSDVDGRELTVSAVDTTSDLGAIITLIDTDSDGSYDGISYDPTASGALQALGNSETATDTFSYTVSDGTGGTDTAYVTLTVEGVNDAPEAEDDNVGDFVTLTASKMTSGDADIFDRFGVSVGLSADGTTLVVGAGDEDDNGSGAGAAYVFDGNGNERLKLLAEDGTSSDSFGDAIAVSADGTRIVVGAPVADNSSVDDGSFDSGFGAGAVYVFDENGIQLLKLTPENPATRDYFGKSVAVSSDGSIIVVGAPDDDDNGRDSGAVHIFNSDGTELRKLTPEDGAALDNFGDTVGISADGLTIIVGAEFDDDKGNSSGSVYVFDAETGEQTAKLTADDGSNVDFFSSSIAISDDGGIIAVGADGADPDDQTNAGAAYLFDATGTQLAKLVADDAEDGAFFGITIAVSGDGSTIAVSSSDSNNETGKVYVFDAQGNQIAKFTPPDNVDKTDFGISLSVSEDGSVIAVGASDDDDAGTGAGAVYTFIRNAEGEYVGFDGTVYNAGGATDDTAGTELTAGNLSEDEVAIIETADLLDNDTDVEGDVLSVTEIDTASAHGAEVALVDTDGDGVFDEVTYDPTAVNRFQELSSGETLDDSFSYTVSDGNGGMDTATVTVTVEGVNDAPVATNDTIRSNDTLTASKLQASDASSNAIFGRAVSVSSEAGYSVVGAWNNDGRGNAYLFDSDGNQIAILDGAEGDDGDEFGWSVAVASDAGTIAVGAPSHDTPSIYDPFADSNRNAGGVYLFDDNGEQTRYITANERDVEDDEFGSSVAISDDGNTIVVGAVGDADKGEYAGAVFLFNGNGRQLRKIVPSDGSAGDSFGSSVAVSSDGSTIVVSAEDYNDANTSGTGTAYIYSRDGNQIAQLTAPESDEFGSSIAISGDGSIILVGAQADADNESDAGAVYVFDSSGVQLEKLTAPDSESGDKFGSAVAASSDGSILALSAVGDDSKGAVLVYSADDDGNYSLISKLTAGDDGRANDFFGVSVDVSDDGSMIIVGASGDDDNGAASGSAYTFIRNTGGAYVGQDGFVYGVDGVTDESASATTGHFSEDESIIITEEELVSNDTDIEGDALYVSGLATSESDAASQSTQSVLGATLTLSDSDGDGSFEISYDPTSSSSLQALAGGETATDTFAYEVSDGNGGTDVATVTLTIEGVNDVPDASDDEDVTSYELTAAKFTGSDIGKDDQFGSAIAVSADGTLMIVGAPNADGVEANSGGIFQFNGSGEEIARLLPENGSGDDSFGSSADISGDGSTVVVGAWGDDDKGADAGAVYVFDGDGNELSKLLPDDDNSDSHYFGAFLAVSDDGERIAVSAIGNDNNGPSTGAVFVFNRNGDEIFTLTPDNAGEDDHFGGSVAVSGDGSTFLVGSTDRGVILESSVYVFDESGQQRFELFAENGADGLNFGESLGISRDGSVILIGSLSDDEVGTDAGAVYVFDQDGNQVDKLLPDADGTDTYFGSSLAVSSDGSVVVVGASGSSLQGDQTGSVYVFDNEGNKIAKLVAPDGESGDAFGTSVDVSEDGSFVTVSAPGDDDAAEDAGAVYTFIRNSEGNYVGPDGTVYGPEGATAETADTSLTVYLSEDDSATISTSDLLENDTDIDGDSLSLTDVDSASANGAELFLLDNDNDGLIDGLYYDPSNAAALQALGAGETLEDTFSYTVSDGNGATDVATVTLTIEGVNDAPEAGDDTIASSLVATTADDSVSDDLTTGTGTLGDAATAGSLQINNTNTAVASSIPVTVFSTSQTTGQVATAFDANGASVTTAIDPTLFAGAGSDSDIVADGTSSAVLGETTSDTVDGISTNAASTDIIGVTNALITEDVVTTIDIDSLLDNDTDAEGDTLVITGVAGSDSDAAATTATSANGAVLTLIDVDDDGVYDEIDYDPTSSDALQALKSDESLNDTFEYQVSDGNGGTDTATVTVAVQGVNDAPDAVDDTAETNEDEAVTIQVLDNDTDVDGDDLSISSFEVVSGGGSVSESNGDLVYVPADDYSGEATLSYTMSDSHGATDTATVTVTVNAVNDAPQIALDDTDISYSDTSGNDSFSTASISYSITDTEGAFDYFTISNPNGEIPGSFSYDPSRSSGALVFIPDDSVLESLTADQSFSYDVTAYDTEGASSTETITVNVSATNDTATIVGNTSGSVTENTSTTVTGTLSITDRDGATSSSVKTTSGKYGDLQYSYADGGWTYTLDTSSNSHHDDVEALGPGSTLTETFTVSSLDNTASETVTITINGSDDAADVSYSVGDPSASIGVLAEDGNPSSWTGSVNVSDIDLSDDVTARISNISVSNAQHDFEYDDYFSVEWVGFENEATNQASLNYTVTILNDNFAVQLLESGENVNINLDVSTHEGYDDTITYQLGGTGTWTFATSGLTSYERMQPFREGSSQEFALAVDDTWTKSLNLFLKGRADFDDDDEVITIEVTYDVYDATSDTITRDVTTTLEINHESIYLDSYDKNSGGSDNKHDKFEIDISISPTNYGASLIGNDTDQSPSGDIFMNNVSVKITASNEMGNPSGATEYADFSYSYRYIVESDPLAFDLNGDGTYFAKTADDFAFEIDGGVARSWTSPDDGILAMDLDGSGAIENGSELFSLSFDGGDFSSGLEALATLDSNQDGLISALDDQFAEIKMWVDADSDGLTDLGELLGLSDHGIEEINLAAEASHETVDGVLVSAYGTATTTSGETVEFAEFGMNNMNVAVPTATLVADGEAAVAEVTAVALAG
ncbi:tandem-95 repeat protein [Roseibium denhamense]|uniref:tandem-95 repeat protein n=1 Tax=Roseibium denhamense TaxID=76305 RepID=UPI0024B7B970|nr:tandem-95 repeat protein [Roseibium denhamense]